MKYKILDFICKVALLSNIFACIKLMEHYITGPVVVEVPLFWVVVLYIAVNDLFAFKCFEDPRIIARRKKISRMLEQGYNKWANSQKNKKNKPWKEVPK